MNLVLDIGNTQYKLSIFKFNEMVHHQYLDDLKPTLLKEILSEYSIEKAIYSDTRGVSHDSIQKHIPKIPLIELTYKTKIPIQLNYKTPKTLGKDRIAAAVGATAIFPNTPVLIIDIGTAITIDFISDKQIYEGGTISPGQELRFKALHNFTGKLPLLEPTNKPNLTGNTTKTAMQFGVQNGILFEINEYISRYKNQYPNLKTIITGGDAYLFDTKIKYAIFAKPFLVPIGLNTIIYYNE